MPRSLMREKWELLWMNNCPVSGVALCLLGGLCVAQTQNQSLYRPTTEQKVLINTDVSSFICFGWFKECSVG